MADRRVKVVFSAEVQNFKKGMEEAAQATQKTAKATEEAGKASDEAGKKSQESTKQTAAEIAGLAAAHKDAAAASGLQYSATGQLVDANGKALSSQQAAAHGLASFSAETYLAAQALDEAAASTEKADGVLQELVASATENSEAWETVGATLLGVGTAAVAGLGLAGKAAMDWETAWAGVTKTVDGTPKQMDELEASLRGLAKTLPSTHEEIAGVAEAAGQLGVKREDVVGFTKTMIDLSETTNLTADEAATSIAQISNVMGTMERDGSKGVERFGATLVALGNAGASTEAEILEMAKRIAGAAKLVGASESDVLALSNAMASLGIEAQLGGGVISRVMQRMYGDVMEGGEGLDRLAKVAGVSAKEFATAFETDPVRAVDMMVKGFGRIKDEGGNVIQTMSDLGIKGTEETGVILRLAGAGDILTDSLKLGDSAWASNSALAEEAAKRYETTESKVKVAWNNIKDAAIEAGAVLLPLIAGVAESVAGLAGWFGSLPDPIKGALSALGGVAGIAALGAGAFLTLTPKILDTIQAFNTLAPAGGRARTALERVGKAAGIAAGIAVVGVALAKIVEADYMSKIDTGMGKVSLALSEIATGGPGASTALDQLFKDRDGSGLGDAIGGVTDLGSAIKRTFNRDASQQFNDWASGVAHGTTGIVGNTQILEDSFKRLDTGLADLVSGGNADDAAKTFEQIKKTADDQGVSVEELAKKFPQYADALKAAEAAAKTAAAEGKNVDGSLTDVGKAAEVAAAQAEEIEKALDDVGLAADGTVTDLDKFVEALGRAGLLQLSTRDAARNYEAALDTLTASIVENGKTLDTSTEKGRANEAAFDAIAGAGLASAQAMARSGEGQDAIQGKLQGTYGDLIKAAEKFDITGQEAENLARKVLGVPDGVSIDSWMSETAKRTAEETKVALEDIPKDVQVKITTVEHKIKILETQVRGGGSPDDPSMTAFDPGSHATGGRVRGYSGGGKLPSSGPGTERTDGFLGISSAGVPLARVDKDEWIINGHSSNRYDRELAAINAGTFPKMPGYANGGREYSAQQLGYAPYRSTGGAASSVTNNFHITTPADPVVTSHEVARRTQSLNP